MSDTLQGINDDFREKIEAIFHSYVPKEDKNMRLALAHTMLNGGTLELDFTNLITEIAEFVDTERRRYAIEQLEKLSDDIEAAEKKLPNGDCIMWETYIFESITRLNGEHDQSNN